MIVSRSSWFLTLVVVVALTAAAVLPLLVETESRLVLYCAHDQALAADVIRRFEQKSGIQVDVRYDEESNKSLGLTQLLLAEKEASRADVFWNNQLLGTIRLQSAGVLQPYRGFGWERMPESCRDVDGYWTAFAARQRVYIINTNRMDAKAKAVSRRLQQPSLQTVAIAEPLFGTTLSHYCLLAEQQGLSELKEWHHDIRNRGIRVVRGNSMVKDLVAGGICDMGYTDTDDAFAAIDAGAPVAMLPVRMQTGQTICLPNTVAMVANCRHPEAAQRFIDFLLSEETELQLAAGAGRQIPLGPVDNSKLSEELQPLLQWAADAVSPARAAEFHSLVVDWLYTESTGQ
jgi:iron(III) transport system substrate-binding protein